MTQTLFSWFQRRTEGGGKAPFILSPTGAVLSYDLMLQRTGALANLLDAMGVQPGDRVAVQADKSPDCILLYLACLRAGATYVPMNPAYTPREVRQILADAQPRLFVCHPKDQGQADDICRELGVREPLTLGVDSDGSLLAAAAAQPIAFRNVEVGPDHLAAILYTSGTTGRPKGAMLTHENLRSNAETLADVWKFTASDRLIHALPVFHTHGLFVATNVVLAAGASMILLPKFVATEVVQSLADGTVLMGVPTFYTRLLEEPTFTADRVKHVRLFVSGSAPLSAETFDRFVERTGHRILERYGMTETNMIASNPYDGARIRGSVGLPLPGVEVRIADAESGRVLEDGVGVIEVRGPNVFKGYWQMPEKTAEEFRDDGFFISGDLGHFDDNGYLHIVGRHKDLIISGGFNIYPAEVEAVIEEVAGVAECAVVGAPHPDLGEAVLAVIARERGASLTEAEVVAAIEPRLARFKQPRRIEFIDELPRNAMGKVQKARLRSEFTAAFTQPVAAAAT
jgi:malonyl-CoA/methylmalonyl-CoA synthetase